MTNKQFKQEARKHQVEFKINDDKIKITAERHQFVKVTNWKTKEVKTVPVPNMLLWEDRKDSDGGYRILYSGFRKDITEKIDNRQKTDPSPSFSIMVTDLLRSEHIPYNLFEPMNYDLKSATNLFNQILGKNKIKKINDILIEYKEKNEKGENGLKDVTAFDVFVDYVTLNGNRGGIGIEVKYTEKEYLLKKGTKEWKETYDEISGLIHLADNYWNQSFKSRWFKIEYIEDVDDLISHKAKEHVVSNQYRQIWRNHILGASMVLDGSLSEFTTLTIYPEGNGHFNKLLWDKYKDKLTVNGSRTFKHLTYEELFQMIRECFNGSKIKDSDNWVDYLERRY
ncbi:MAG: hypothetical protein J1E95_11440 [Muribaculaceae bacterium]|nr:hypothetical protein [Muribaculaceae bacterium]